MGKATNGSECNSIKTYRKALLQKKAELLVSLGLNFKGLADTERASNGDLVAVSEKEFLQLALHRVLRGQLRHVEAALDRMAAGAYGTCVNCGQAVSSKRLQAVPWAAHCLACLDQTAGGATQELGGPAIPPGSRSKNLTFSSCRAEELSPEVLQEILNMHAIFNYAETRRP